MVSQILLLLLVSLIYPAHRMIDCLMAGVSASQFDLGVIRTAICDKNWVIVILCGWIETDVCNSIVSTL